MVDCVTQALFGSEENKNLLIHFLNAFMEPSEPLVDVTFLTPSEEYEPPPRRHIVIDLNAQTAAGKIYHVQLQTLSQRTSREQLLYLWSRAYRDQVRSDPLGLDKPMVAIWLLGERYLDDIPGFHHRIELQVHGHAVGGSPEAEPERVSIPGLTDLFDIQTLELPKWERDSDKLDDKNRWGYFLSQAHSWDALPAELVTPEMQQAMGILRDFSERESSYALYCRRQEARRLQVEQERIERAQRPSEVATPV